MDEGFGGWSGWSWILRLRPRWESNGELNTGGRLACSTSPCNGSGSGTADWTGENASSTSNLSHSWSSEFDYETRISIPAHLRGRDVPCRRYLPREQREADQPARSLEEGSGMSMIVRVSTSLRTLSIPTNEDKEADIPWIVRSLTLTVLH